MTNFDFWAIKHAIDDEVARVGWSKEKCIVYIAQRYHARSRLAMTDEQLLHFLEHLRSLPSRKVSTHKLRTRSRRDKRRY
jgi:hypothetical protein